MGKIWDEDEGMVAFESHTPKARIFHALHALDLRSDDMLLLGSFGAETVHVIGRLKDITLLDMIDIE